MHQIGDIRVMDALGWRIAASEPGIRASLHPNDYFLRNQWVGARRIRYSTTGWGLAHFLLITGESEHGVR
jgi:hypothetical protein